MVALSFWQGCPYIPSYPCSFWLNPPRVPVQKLKAALDEALVTFVRIPSNVAPMFEMLLHSVIVRPANYQDLKSTLARADLSYQLNEIEAC